jgi:hypothetical protein
MTDELYMDKNVAYHKGSYRVSALGAKLIEISL